VLFNLTQYLLSILVLLPLMMVWFRVAPVPPMILFPVFVGLQTILAVGLALILATLTVFLRDIRHLLEIALAVMFWLTPIIYELPRVPNDGLRLLVLLSPMTPFVVTYQQLFFYRHWPDATLCVVAAVYAVGAFVLGTLLMLSFEDRLVEYV
jgi:ABC-type polysaccharide/polyol phosphate export permease